MIPPSLTLERFVWYHNTIQRDQDYWTGDSTPTMTPRRTLSGRQLAATAALLCSLVGRSAAYAAASGGLAVPNTPTAHNKLSAPGSSGRTASGHGQFAALAGGGASSPLPAGAEGSRGRLFETVTSLRGGSPDTKIPGLDAAVAAITSISVPAIAWTGGPALFAQVSSCACVLCVRVCAYVGVCVRT